MHSAMELCQKVQAVKVQGPPNERIKSIEELIKGMKIPKIHTKIWVSKCNTQIFIIFTFITKFINLNNICSQVRTIEKTTRNNSKSRPSAEVLLDSIEKSNMKKVENLQSENEHLKEEIRRMRMQQGSGLYWRSSLTDMSN